MASPVLYTVMTGLEAAVDRQALQANNLVNANTPGFRAQLAALVSAPLHGPAADRGMADAIARDAGYSREQGDLEATGSAWDVAFSNGNGWLVTQRANGQILLTQDGRLHQGQDGLLRDSRGDAVLGANLRPISLPELKHFEIGTDGAISGVLAGGGSRLAQQFNRLYIAATPAQPLTRMGGGRFGGVANVQTLSRATSTEIKQGYLNQSDVNSIRAMTDLITDVRSFQLETELQQSTAQSANGLDTLISEG